MRKNSLSLLHRLNLCCLALVVLAVASVARAGDPPPTFSDPAVTTFVKSYGEFADQYAATMKEYMAATKSGDTTKMQASAKKVQEVTAKSADMQTQSTTVGSKIKPDEVQKFSGYLQACAQKMADAAK